MVADMVLKRSGKPQRQQAEFVMVQTGGKMEVIDWLLFSPVQSRSPRLLT